MSGGLYRQVTEAVLAQLGQTSDGSWICPWHQATGGLPVNGVTGQRYRGANILSLWCAAVRLGFTDSRWATYRQWHAQGAQVRRGENGTLVVFYKPTNSPEHSEADSHDSEAKHRYILRMSVAFNAEQCEGVARQRKPDSIENWTAKDFDAFVGRTGAVVRFGGEKAYYNPATDEICLPPRGCFNSPDGYAGTASHELVHWTGAKTRLSRDLSGQFGDQAYAAEELIAELGSAFLLAGLGLASTPHPNHAAYVASWLPLLREDPRAIFVAAAHASRAAEWLFEKTSRDIQGGMTMPDAVRNFDDKAARPSRYDEAGTAVS